MSDIESLVSFLETSQDMACIEDVLHMIIRALSQKSLLASFLDQVNLVGGCHLFINLLQRYVFFVVIKRNLFVCMGHFVIHIYFSQSCATLLTPDLIYLHLFSFIETLIYNPISSL